MKNKLLEKGVSVECKAAGEENIKKYIFGVKD